MQLRSLLIRLHLAHGTSYVAITRILHYCRQQHTVVTDAGFLSAIGQLKADAAQNFQQDWGSQAFQKRVQRHANLDVLTILDGEYPQALLESFEPPLVLFLKGHRDLLATRKLAVVGARQMTSYGRRCLGNLLPPLIPANLTIVSGLAAGVDACAHQTALHWGLPVIGVIGSGLDVCYPHANAELQARVSQVGLLISEYPLGSRPQRFHFPQRNRIIAGLCQTLVVIEARERSGSLITANLALQNNRNVLAVPGPIDAPLSVGCNQLITAGAKPVLNSAHIIEEFLPII